MFQRYGELHMGPYYSVGYHLSLSLISADEQNVSRYICAQIFAKVF